MVDYGGEPTAKPRRWGKSRPLYGKVVAVEGLCKLACEDDKDTIRVEIDLGESGLQYTPGDALGVYPLNCNQVDSQLVCTSSEGPASISIVLQSHRSDL